MRSASGDTLTGGLGGTEQITTEDLLNIPAWYGDALCAQVDPEVFFPEKGGSTREAKATCARCPVAAECIDYALETRERFGIWGGTSERERRAILRDLYPNESEYDDTAEEGAA